MLSAKPWKPDAIVRLLLSLIIFMFAGSLVASTIYYVGAGGKVAARFFLLGSGALVFLGATLVLISRRWTLENLRCRLIVLMICLYAGMGLWAWAQKIAGAAPPGHPPWQMIIGTLSFQGAVLLLSVLFVRWHQVTWREAFGLSNHWHQAILFGALTALIFFPVASWLQRASVELMKGVLHLHVKGEEQLAVQTLRHAVSWLDQVTLGAVVIKATARKVRRLYQDRILAGFAGATADAFTLFERFEAKLDKHQGNLLRSAVELAKDWRTDRMLRRLEAMLAIADRETSLLITGTGDVLEPERGLLAIGSGGGYAQAAALALMDNSALEPADIVKKSLAIAGELCIYTNQNHVIETL